MKQLKILVKEIVLSRKDDLMVTRERERERDRERGGYTAHEWVGLSQLSDLQRIIDQQNSTLTA